MLRECYSGLKLTLAERVALSAEALRTQALEAARHVEALGVDSAGVGASALVDVDTLLVRRPRVAGRTRAGEAAVGVGALRVHATRRRLTFVNI